MTARLYRRVLLEDLHRWTAIGWRPAVTFRDELGEVVGVTPLGARKDPKCNGVEPA